MTIWRHFTIGVLFCIGTLPALATTFTLSSGANITLAVEQAQAGDTIQLTAGDYVAADTLAWGGQKAFGITKAVHIIGLGATPAAVRLRGVVGSDYTVKFATYGSLGNPSGASLQNLTIDTADGGVQIYDYLNHVRLTDITIKDVIILTRMTAQTNAGNSFGVYLNHTDRIVIDGAKVTSYQSGFYFTDANDTLLMNSTVPNTGAANATGLAVLGGSGNTITGNTFGTTKLDPASPLGYSFAGGGVVFYNSQANRFENNAVQGHRDDGLDFHAPAATQRSSDNYVGKNNIISTGFAAGRLAGSAIWVNCGSDNSWLYANDAQGSAECGTCVWLSKNNLLLANQLHDNRLSGIFVSGGNETKALCPIPAYQQKPAANFLQSNNIYYNGSDQLVVRSSDSTTIASNFMSSRNGVGGALRTCTTPGCQGQGAFVLQGDPAISTATSNGVLLAANTSSDNQRGLWSDDGKVLGLEFYSNRMRSSITNRFVSSGSNLSLDWGPSLGGNYWSQHPAVGNPSTTTPYTGVYDNATSHTGLVVDRYPFQDEDFGRGHAVTVYEPRAGAVPVATGTRRTVRWYAPGCSYVDVLLDGTTDLASNLPNIGYAVVTIRTTPPPGPHRLVVKCKDSSGQVRGQGSSADISVTNQTLQLMTPGRDDVFNAGQTIFVGWKKTSPVTSVNIEFSADNGASFTTLASGQTGTFARVTLPSIASTAYAIIRITEAGGAGDSTDGVFAVRGDSGAGFANVGTGRQFVMGQQERLEWASSRNSRLVDLTVRVGNSVKTVAANLPDRGNFDWIVPDLGEGPMTLTLNFKTSDGTAITSASTSQAGSLYPTAIVPVSQSITFGAAPMVVVNGTANVSASASSGLPVSFSSLTPSVCTLAGAAVTGQAVGTCTIAADQLGNGNYSAAPTVSQSFAVVLGASTGRLANLSTRGRVQTGSNVLIGGFIIGGAAPKTVLVRAIGPNLANYAVPGVLADPMLQLYSGQTMIASNNNWQTATNAAAIQATTLAPMNPLESAILMSLSPGPYTAIVTGVNNGTGVGLVEVFEIDHPEIPLINIATRGLVQTGSNVLIGGFIIQGGPLTVLIRAVGPNLANYGVPGVLADPKLDLYAGPTLIASNDNWQTAPNAAAIQATTLAPASPLESAILMTLDPGPYTAVVGGANGGTGVGIVELFAR